MTERPIPFRDWEVRATLKGTKRQVRRVIKLLNGGAPPTESETVSKQLSSMTDPEFNGAWTWWGGKPLAPITKPLFCPYGKPGDLLWVRETWAPLKSGNVDFAADWSDTQRNFAGKWRPSIHMPRWASRITLRIADVRVERLQDITEDDARAEGVGYKNPGYLPGTKGNWIGSFAYLWNHLNGPDAWNANPWVWVINFERVTP